MVNDKKDLGQLLAVDMPNGFTYIGRLGKMGSVGDRPLMLQDGLTFKTDDLTQMKKYKESAYNLYCEFKKVALTLEKEIRIDNPGAIHFLEQ